MKPSTAGEFLIYQSESGQTRLEVRLSGETVWLTQAQMAELFQTSSENISLHLKNIFEDNELDETATVEDFSIVRPEGNRTVRRNLKHYNLDAIISVGYRVKSHTATRFRQWATGQLKEFLVKGDTEALVKSTAQAIHEMPPIYKTRITTELYRQSMSHTGIEGEQISGGIREVAAAPQLPDLLAYLQNSTELTHHTLVRILKQSERLADFIRNPQIFINQVTDCMQRELHGVTVKGIQYEKIGGAVYEMHQIEEENGITRYLNNLYEVQNIEKTLYDYVEYDSDVEKEFAKSCDSDERVKFYCKLPPQFKVDTPVGPYNPDWALVTEGEEKLYLIRETKSTRNEAELRDKERDKITCGRRHFEAIGVDYEVVTTLDEALNG